MIDYLKKNRAILSFLLCFLFGCIIVIPNIINGGGIYRLRADFDYQQIPFNMLINDSIKSGNIFYSFFNDLGSNFIGTFSFYNLFSIFNIIGYLFPAKFYPYLIGPIFILKYAVCGLFSYLFLERYVKNKNYAVVGALLYTFSGFQLTNILYYHFHDVVAFFPLLLYSFDKLIYDNKKGLFAISVFICAITNWFFFIAEVIILVIYYFVGIFVGDYKFDIKTFLTIITEGLFGTLMASFVLIPSFLFTLSNPRLGTSWVFIDAIKHPVIRYTEIIRAMFLPPDTMQVRSFFEESNFHSVELFLPFIGLVAAFSYIIKKPKDKFSVLTILCFIIMFIPILNSMFVLFNTTYYARWFFAPILFISVLSIKAFDEGISLKNGFIVQILGMLLLVLITIIYKARFEFNSYDYLIFVIVLCIICMISLFFISISKRNKILLLVIGIIIYTGLIGNYMVVKYKEYHVTNKEYREFLKVGDYSKYNNYRINSYCPVNSSYIKKIMTVNSFNSNISGSAFEFYKSIGIDRDVSTIIEDTNIMRFLGAKYDLYCSSDTIYENDALTIGFIPNNFISVDEFNSLSNEEKINRLFDSVVLNDDQISRYSKYFNGESTYNSSFKLIKNGFKSNIDSNDKKLVVYQIPYDDGWVAYNNNKRIEIEKVDNGLIGVLVNKGNNNIIFKYKTPGLLVGLIVSIITTFSYLVYIMYNKNTTK